MDKTTDLTTDGDFDFKPLNDGLGFHRKPQALENDEADDTFAFSAVGSNVVGTPIGAPLGTERSEANNLLSGGSAELGSSATSFSKNKSRHNSKSVSDLIAALPPALDFLNEAERAKVVPKPGAPAAPSLSSPSSAGKPSVGSLAAAAASAFGSSVDSTTTSKEEEKRGFLKMPLGREDYKAAAPAPTKAAASTTSPSIDQNLAKAFPHLGRLAGHPAIGTPGYSANVSAAIAAAAAASATIAAPTVAITPAASTERALPTHFGSAILDTLVAVGLGCVLLAITLAITNVNLMALLENSQTDKATMLGLALLFIAGGMVYVLAGRGFMGATLGEWSYEVRVGNSEMRTRWFYPVLVVWREILVAATGFVLFPILSSLAGRDLLRYLTGLEVVSLDNRAPLN